MSNESDHQSGRLLGRMFRYIASPGRGANSSLNVQGDVYGASLGSKSSSYFVFHPDFAQKESYMTKNSLSERSSESRASRTVASMRNAAQSDDYMSHRSSDDPIGSGSGCKQAQLLVIFLAIVLASIVFSIELFTLLPPRTHPDATPENHTTPIDAKQLQRMRDQEEILKRWLVASPKCHIPVLDPWDESIKSYVRRKDPMNCSEVIDKFRVKMAKEKLDIKDYKPEMQTKQLTYVNNNLLYFTDEALKLQVLKRLLCCSRPISRETGSDDDLVYQDTCDVIDEQGYDVAAQHELVKVECNELNYTQVHRFIKHDTDVEKAYGGVAKKNLNLDNHYNVLMLGVDTMSRLNSMRQLNSTLSYLKKEYDILEFTGYNKVGENTFPNLIPLLTGLKPGQLTKTQCWMASNYTEDNDHGDDYLDNCKYLWYFYQQFGYITYFSEDWPSASTFNYLKPGFKYEPTHIYGRPFTLARKSLLFPKFESIGCASCQLDRPIVEVDMENLKSFVEGYRDKPYFAFHWINCPQHDDLNGASQVDHILEDFFRQIKNITKSERTFVIFFSDHGYRWNDFVSTRIGHYEASLPMLYIAAPDVFIQRHPDLYARLKEHQNSLLTPFDMFKTLIDLRNMSAKAESVNSKLLERKRKTRGNKDVNTDVEASTYPTAKTTVQQHQSLDGLSYEQSFQSISLFDKHSPEELDRSCIEAGIPDNYCVCHQFETIETNATDVLGVAYYLVYIHFESRLRDHLKICHQLEFDKVHTAQMFDFTRSETTKHKTAMKRSNDQRQLTSTTSKPGAEGNKGGAESGRNKTRAKSTLRPSTTSRPVDSRVVEQENHDGHGQYLPNREYNVAFSTKPGFGLFQEVVRFYGNDLEECQEAIGRARRVVEDQWANFTDKHSSVKQMNQICHYSVHSDSISRLNLYKDQSKCVKNNIELKKICYCR